MTAIIACGQIGIVKNTQKHGFTKIDFNNIYFSIMILSRAHTNTFEIFPTEKSRSIYC